MAVRHSQAVQWLSSATRWTRKRPQRDRSHKPWGEANGGARCGKSARCVRRGGGWKRGTVERPPGAPVLDLTDERGRETECWPSALSHRARPRLYHRDNSLLATTASLQGKSGHEWTFMSGLVLPGKLSLLHGALSPRRAPTSKLPIIETPTGGVLAGRSSPPGTERGSKPEIFSRYHPAVGEYPDRAGDHWSCRLPRCVMGRAIASGWHGPPVF